jgi:uncharacterized membrane protein YecN with MAPEG domain
LAGLPIIGLYVSLLAGWLFYLGLRVANMRKAHQIGMGDKENRILAVAIRVHGNAIENVPISLLLLLMCSLSGASVYFLHAVGVALLLSRISHAYGMTISGGRYSIFRLLGILVNWLLMLLMIGVNLFYYLAAYS